MRHKYPFLTIEQIKVRYQKAFPAISPFDAGIPLLELSDKVLEQIYYYRWNSFCSHIKPTIDGFVVTEFTPPVPWEGIYGTICCPVGHHLYEGRWLHRNKYMDDYARFWFTEDAEPHLYSTWLADAVYAMCKTRGDFTLSKDLYKHLKEDFFLWEQEKLMENGLFYQVDDLDGMEFSISGNGCRPTINSYMYGNAVALSKIAELCEKKDDADLFREKAKTLKEKMDSMLWQEDTGFYETLSEKNNYCAAGVREQIGYLPWYFGMAEEDKDSAWKFLCDERHFLAPYGLTTAERCHPEFMAYHKHECLWNGPVWPFATSQTLTAMGNLLRDHNQSFVTKDDYFKLLRQYADSQFIETETGERIPYVDEDLDPMTGRWLARDKMLQWESPRKDAHRGVNYNHSSFCDLILSGLVGLRPRDDEWLEIDPLFTEHHLDYLCADGILYHGKFYSILWDPTGSRYNQGPGFHVFRGKEKIATASTPQKILIDAKK